VLPFAILLRPFGAEEPWSAAAQLPPFLDSSWLCYNLCMKFEWDPKKARSNFRKHKVSFEEAVTALSDPMAVTGADPDHSIDEFRYITFGISERGRLLGVAHCEHGETIRIISARPAQKGERKIYEEG
jgi:hypothetical protein